MFPDPACLPPPHPDCRFIVGIPARDEAERIGACLDSFAAQRRRGGREFPRAAFEVIVLANNCADATADAARGAAARHPGLRVHVVEAQLPAAAAHVGTARRWLMDVACRRLAHELGRPGGIVATTDADARVSPTWLDATEREVARGAEAVGGYIRACPRELAALPAELRRFGQQVTEYNFLAARLEARLDPDPHDPWPRHFHHNGASLAATARTCARVGGMPALPALEDMAFHAALARHDVAFRHSPAVRVIASARTTGRTPRGMAVTIAEWISALRSGRPPCLVESAAALERRFLRRRLLRAQWREAGAPGNFGELWEKCAASVASGGTMDVSEAVLALRARLGLAKVLPAVFGRSSRDRAAAPKDVQPVFSTADAA